MTSLATTMSKASSRGTPPLMPPRPTTTPRRARSLRSTTRRMWMRRGSTSSSLPKWMWLSSMVAARLFAAAIAAKSPVKWRLMSSIGTTWAWPPPAAPPFIPKTGPMLGSRSASTARPTSGFDWASSLSPSARPMLVVVLPSPAGVGLMAVTRVSRPSVAVSAALLRTSMGTLALVHPWGMMSCASKPSPAATSTMGSSSALSAISISVVIRPSCRLYCDLCQAPPRELAQCASSSAYRNRRPHRCSPPSGAHPGPLRHGLDTRGEVRCELAEQRRELRPVPRTGRDDDETVDLVDDEILVRGVREQAGGLRIRFRNESGQIPFRVVDHPGPHLLGDLSVLVKRGTDHLPTVELREFLPGETGIPSAGQSIGEHLVGLVDERRPGSRRPPVLVGVPIGHVEGLLLPHLEPRQSFEESCRKPEVAEEVGQPTAGGDDDAVTFDGLPRSRGDTEAARGSSGRLGDGP